MNSAVFTPCVPETFPYAVDYNWDVIILTNHGYAGIGRYCETLEDVIRYAHEFNCVSIIGWKNNSLLCALYDECAPFSPYEYRTPRTYDWSL